MIRFDYLAECIKAFPQSYGEAVNAFNEAACCHSLPETKGKAVGICDTLINRSEEEAIETKLLKPSPKEKFEGFIELMNFHLRNAIIQKEGQENGEVVFNAIKAEQSDFETYELQKYLWIELYYGKDEQKLSKYSQFYKYFPLQSIRSLFESNRSKWLIEVDFG